jgi:hypothetical protein
MAGRPRDSRRGRWRYDLGENWNRPAQERAKS